MEERPEYQASLHPLVLHSFSVLIILNISSPSSLVPLVAHKYSIVPYAGRP